MFSSYFNVILLFQENQLVPFVFIKVLFYNILICCSFIALLITQVTILESLMYIWLKLYVLFLRLTMRICEFGVPFALFWLVLTALHVWWCQWITKQGGKRQPAAVAVRRRAEARLWPVGHQDLASFCKVGPRFLQWRNRNVIVISPAPSQDRNYYRVGVGYNNMLLSYVRMYHMRIIPECFGCQG